MKMSCSWLLFSSRTEYLSNDRIRPVNLDAAHQVNRDLRFISCERCSKMCPEYFVLSCFPFVISLRTTSGSKHVAQSGRAITHLQVLQPYRFILPNGGHNNTVPVLSMNLSNIARRQTIPRKIWLAVWMQKSASAFHGFTQSVRFSFDCKFWHSRRRLHCRCWRLNWTLQIFLQISRLSPVLAWMCRSVPPPLQLPPARSQCWTFPGNISRFARK